MKSFSVSELARGIILSIIIFFALTAVFSLISLRFDDPEEYLSLFSGIVLAVSVFAGAMAASKGNRKVTCLLFGAAALLLFGGVGSFWAGGIRFPLMKAAIIVLSAFAGCIVCKRERGTVTSAKRRKNVKKRYGAYR